MPESSNIDGARGKRDGRCGGTLGGIYAFCASRRGKDLIGVFVAGIGTADFRKAVFRIVVSVGKRRLRAVRTAQRRDAAAAVVLHGQRVVKRRRSAVVDGGYAAVRIAERNPVGLDGPLAEDDFVQPHSGAVVEELDDSFVSRFWIFCRLALLPVE